MQTTKFPRGWLLLHVAKATAPVELERMLLRGTGAIAHRLMRERKDAEPELSLVGLWVIVLATEPELSPVGLWVTARAGDSSYYSASHCGGA
ncbi:MAG: hypothetical protein AAF802_26600 [Planctomycetota bacterium]